MLSTTLAVLVYVNPCLHPLIYATRYDAFKQSLSAIRQRVRVTFAQNSSIANAQ